MNLRPIDYEAVGDQSGHSVALSSDGQTLAVGAPGNGSGAGHVRVYAWSGLDWSQLGDDIDLLESQDTLSVDITCTVME